MKIGISTTSAHGRRDGVGQYINNLLLSLQAIDVENEYLIYTRRRDLGEFAITQPRFRAVPVSNRLANPLADIIWHNTLYVADMQRQGVNLLHLPEYRRIPVPRRMPTLLTIQDMARYHIRDKYDRFRMFYHMRVMPLLFRAGRPDHIIAISENTRRDILRFLRVDPACVSVVYHGANERFRPVDRATARATAARYALPEQYLLYVSRLEHPGKNHVTLLRAFADLKRRRPAGFGWKLVLVGTKALGHEQILAELARLRLEQDVILTGFVPDEDLPALYAASSLCVYPSLYEGFGIPVVEAMRCGVAVAVADNSSLPEIVGAAGRLVPTRDVAAWSQALEALLEDAPLREQMAAAGIEQAAQFTWERTAQQTLALYRQVAALG